MFSVLYLTEKESILPILEETVKEYASQLSIPFHTISLDRLPSIGEFIKNKINTTYTLLMNEKTYPHLRNLSRMIEESKNLKQNWDLVNGHFIDDMFDISTGYLFRSQHFHNFKPSPFTTFDQLSRDLTSYIKTISGLIIVQRQGFNVLNFEGTYYHTHHCDKCIESFTKSHVLTLGNMSVEDIKKYHRGVIKKNVQIAIALMIKDEEQKIQETLDYYKNENYFPEFFILDTGSTDRTLEKVNEWKDAHPSVKIVIYEQPFVDFSTSRNYLLDKCYENATTEYIISIDCNDEMKGQDRCIESLNIYYHFPAIFIDQIWKSINTDSICFTNIRIVKNNGKYRWRYRVHEVLMTDVDIPLMIRLPQEAHLYQYREPEYEAIKSARYHRDLKFFLEDVEKYPEDKRLAYYLSQTYFFCGDFENCISSGKRRIALNKKGEYDEECYQTILRICKCKMFLGKELYNIKKWWWYAWDYFIPIGKKDIEPLLQIALMYEEDKEKGGDIDTAIHFYELACQTPKPSFNLPVRHELYAFERYKRLADLYYKKRNFAKVYEIYRKIVDYRDEKTGESSVQAKAVNDMLSLYYPSRYYTDKPLLVIYGGFFYDRFWNGKKFYEKTISLGGSESMVIKLAHLFSKEYRVYVFLHTEDEINYEGVQYLRTERMNDFIEANHIKHLILSRDPSRITSHLRKNVDKVYLWLHDMTEIANLTDEKLYDKIITLSPFHKKWYDETFLSSRTDLSVESKSSLRKKLTIIPNFITSDVSQISHKVVKGWKPQTHRFIYSSCPTRGLIKVVSDFVELQKAYPHAELYIYSDFNNDYVRSKMPGDSVEVKQFIEKMMNTKGIFNVGRLPEEVFLEECKKANFWYYPTNFTETFCITAVQMMLNGIIPIYSNVGALSNVIGDAGIVLDEKNTLTTIVKMFDQEDKRNQLIKKGIEKSKTYIASNVKKEWQKLL